MDDKNFDNYIKKVRNNICNIYNAFYLWKNLSNAEYNEIYNKNKYFWGIIISSLQLNWLLGIAKLFEEPKKGQEEVIAIPLLFKFIPEGKNKEKIRKEIENKKSVLKNLWQWRCKILAHQDKLIAENLQNFYKQYPIKGLQIEDLLVFIKDILGRIKSSTSNKSEVYSFKVFIEESKTDLEDIINKLKNVCETN